MKISSDGKLLDPKLEEGKLIVKSIYCILHQEWLGVMKEEFVDKEMEFIATVIFFFLLFNNDPSKEEPIDLLYACEIENATEEPSLSRCGTLIDAIFDLRPWVELNRNRTDDPNYPRLSA